MHLQNTTGRPAEHRQIALQRGRQAPRRRRVDEKTLAFAVAEWLDGGEWTQGDAVWHPVGNCDGRGSGSGVVAVSLRADGHTLSQRGYPVLVREPHPAIVKGPNYQGVSDARAVCAVALRGDHLTLYG